MKLSYNEIQYLLWAMESHFNEIRRTCSDYSQYIGEHQALKDKLMKEAKRRLNDVG